MHAIKISKSKMNLGGACVSKIKDKVLFVDH
jgi:hypothetical protein